MASKTAKPKREIVKASQEVIPTPSNGTLTLAQQAHLLIKSGILPTTLRQPEQVIAIMLRGKELGIGPMEALTSINVIQGKVSSSTQLMLALIYRSGLLEDIEMVRGDPAKCVMKRKGMTPHVVEFGKKDAAAMGLLNKDAYRKFPETMYLWRCIAMCARVVFPDVVGAVYTADELGMEIQSDLSGNQPVESEEPVADLARLEKEIREEKPDLPLPAFTKLLSERSGVSVSVPRAKQLMNGG